MSTILYYLPEASTAAAQKGLAGRLESGQHQQTLSAGPDGGRGTIIAASDRIEPGRIRYQPAEQTWQSVDGGKYWIGTISAESPTPDDLIRKKPLAGHWIELADGKPWLCPVARGQGQEDGRMVWYHTLPRAVVLQPNGTWAEGPVVSRWARLWQLAADYWKARVGSASEDVVVGDAVTFDFQAAAAAAVECLAVNYRLTALEVSMLGLLDTDSPRQILDALIDWPTLVALSAELQKKTELLVSAP